MSELPRFRFSLRHLLGLTVCVAAGAALWPVSIVWAVSRTALTIKVLDQEGYDRAMTITRIGGAVIGVFAFFQYLSVIRQIKQMYGEGHTQHASQASEITHDDLQAVEAESSSAQIDYDGGKSPNDCSA